MQCPECAAVVKPGDRFCSSCAAPLNSERQDRAEPTADASQPATAPIAKFPEGPSGGVERRQVTALFADIVDSTALAEKIGDEALFSLMQTVVSEMTHAVQDHGGAVEKLTGDGLMALFGAPLAVEDAPLNACRAGLDIIARVMAASGSLAAEHGQRPEIRIGINTGHAVVGSLGTELQQEVTALGHSVNVAARLEGLAEPDSLVIGEATYQLVKDYVDAEFVGEHQVRGKSDAQRIWRVDALETGVRRFDASLRRGLTTLVGRRSELETMLDIQEIVRGGEAQVMNVVGEAGLGKSRLVHEFRQRLPSEDVTWLQGNCSASGREVPFLPFIEVVRSSFGVAENTDGAAIEHRLSRGLEMLGLDPTEGVPYLLNLLGFDVTGIEFSKEHAEIAGIRTRDLLHRLLMEYARVTPVVMHIDDLHWLDSASEALLARMIEDAGDLPLFFLFSYRPEYRPPWAGAKTAKTLELSPLSTDSTAELLRHRLGVEDLPAELTRLVTEKAEGNPLFAEEIVNFLTERGVFDEGEDKDVAPAAMVGLPVSLENLLMARVDRLDDEPRRLLQAASVIGRSFNHEIAGEAAGLDGRAASCVAQLERLELVREDPASGDYLFKHALIQDAVYNSLLGDRLEALHERVADAMERRNSGRLGEIAETLAHHYSRTPRAEKAVRYMAQAGEKSLRVYSLDEAELRLRQVVELIEKVPGCADDAFLIDVLLNLGRVQAFRADMYGLIELLEPHLAKAEALGDPRRLGRFLIEIGAAHACSANAAVGFPLLERGMEIAEEAGDELTVGYAMLGLMLGCTYWEEINGPWRQKITRLTVEGERIGRKFNDNYLTANAIVCMSLLNTIGGRPGEARKHALRLIELSRETNDPRPRSMALWALAVVDFTQLAFEDALESGREGARLALSVFDRNFAEMFVAAGDIMLGRTSEGRPLMSSLNDLFLRRGMFVAVTTSGPLIGVAMIMDGEMAAGFRWIEQCLEKYRSWGHNSAVPLGHLILGELYTRMALGQDRPSLGIMVCNLPFLIRTLPRVTAIARHHLEIALTFFEQADMPSYAAWALYDLALLDQKKGRTAEAAAKLTEARELAQPVEALTLLEMIDAAAKPVS